MYTYIHHIIQPSEIGVKCSIVNGCSLKTFVVSKIV